MKKGIVISLVMTIIFIISSIGVVNAATGSVSISATSNEIEKGKNVEIIISAESVDKVNGITATLGYDDQVLEYVSGEVTSENWSKISNGKNEIAVITNNGGIAQDNIYKLTFKVKENTIASSATVKLSGVTLSTSVSGSDGNVNIGDRSVTINIKGNNSGNSNSGVGDSGNQTASTSINNSQNSSNNQGNKSDASTKLTKSGTSTSKTSTVASKTKLPKTGTNYILVAIMAIGGVLAVTFYKLYIKYKDVK